MTERAYSEEEWRAVASGTVLSAQYDRSANPLSMETLVGEKTPFALRALGLESLHSLSAEHSKSGGDLRKLASLQREAELLQGTPFASSLQLRIANMMAENNIDDPRFLTEEHIKENHWRLMDGAVAIEYMIDTGSKYFPVENVKIYSAGQVLGAPSLAESMSFAKTSLEVIHDELIRDLNYRISSRRPFNPLPKRYEADGCYGHYFDGFAYGGYFNLEKAMKENKWSDNRFLTTKQIEQLQLELMPNATKCPESFKEHPWWDRHEVIFYNASQVRGMPSLEDMKVAAEINRGHGSIVFSPLETILTEQKSPPGVMCFVRCDESSLGLLQNLGATNVQDYDHSRHGVDAVVTASLLKKLADFPSDFQAKTLAKTNRSNENQMTEPSKTFEQSGVTAAPNF